MGRWLDALSYRWERYVVRFSDQDQQAGLSWLQERIQGWQWRWKAPPAAVQWGLGVLVLGDSVSFTVGLYKPNPFNLPEGLACEIDLASWTLPPVFRWLAETAKMTEAELLKTFNCGIGMMLAVAADQADMLTRLLESQGESVTRLGRVVRGDGVLYQGHLNGAHFS